MTSLLKNLRNTLKKAQEKRNNGQVKMDKTIAPYLFLFDSNIYTDSREFSYRHSEEKGVKQWSEIDWFVGIVYHPGSLLTIHTGYCYLNHGMSEREYDKTPDANKIEMAFANRIKRNTKNVQEDVEWMDANVQVLEGVNLP